MDPYTGPYWSDGKLQTSVEFGKSLPRTWRAYNSRLHDTAFARFQDERHRTAADWIYNQALQLDDSVISQVVRFVPLVGNRSGHLLSLFTLGLGPLAAAAAYLDYNSLVNEIRDGGYETEIQDVLQLYAQDPDPVLLSMGGAVTTTAVYGDDWSNNSDQYRQQKEWRRKAAEPKVAPLAAVTVDTPPTPSVYDGRPKDDQTLPALRGAALPTPIPTRTPLPGSQPLNTLLPPINRSDLSVLITPEENFAHTLAYTPYKPLKPLTRRPPDARTVALYNKYHKKNITLDEALAKFYGQ